MARRLFGIFLVCAACGNGGERAPVDDSGAADDVSSEAAAHYGVYEVREIKRNDASCDERGARSDRSPVRYFRLAPGTLDGRKVPLAYYPCESPDECSENMLQSKAFTLPKAGGQWTAPPRVAAGPTGDEQRCSLAWSRTILKGEGDGKLSIRDTSGAGTVTLPPTMEACPAGEGERTTADEQKLYEERGTTVPCQAVTVMRASRL